MKSNVLIIIIIINLINIIIYERNEKTASLKFFSGDIEYEYDDVVCYKYYCVVKWLSELASTLIEEIYYFIEKGKK